MQAGFAVKRLSSSGASCYSPASGAAPGANCSEDLLVVEGDYLLRFKPEAPLPDLVHLREPLFEPGLVMDLKSLDPVGGVHREVIVQQIGQPVEPALARAAKGFAHELDVSLRHRPAHYLAGSGLMIHSG